MNKEKNIHTFLGCDKRFDESRIVLFGAPFDGTTSYRPGTRFASGAIRNESDALEMYSPYLNRDLSDTAVFDGGDLPFCFGNPEKTLRDIEAYVSEIYAHGKIPFMLGGEHLVTLGAVSAAVKTHPGLHIIHFDAHADLRDDYLGEALSHATVMRRCWELTGDGAIFQFGIRSGDKSEFLWAADHVHTQLFNFEGLDDCVRQLRGKPVYLSLDLDVLDPSAFPGTGTPEAGGVSFTELLSAVQTAFALDIVGVDVTELSPPLDPSGASTALACKITREILLQL